MNVGGFELKACSTYTGHEGETCLQGKLYFDGKKIGTFNEDTWSGMIDYHLDEQVNEKNIEKEATNYLELNKFGWPLKPSKYDLAVLYKGKSIEGMLSILHELYFIEKRAKKSFKSGYEYYVIAQKTKNHNEVLYSCMGSHLPQLRKDFSVIYVFEKKDFGIK